MNNALRSLFARSALLVFCFTASAPATAQNTSVNVFWFEDASCAAWAKSSNNRLLRAQYEFWIRGFVSGHNYGNPTRQVKTGTLPGGEQLYHFLDTYCRDNPASSFVGGAIRLVEELRDAPAPPKPPGKPAPASK